MSLFPGNGGADGAAETPDKIPATLTRRVAVHFWLAVLLTFARLLGDSKAGKYRYLHRGHGACQ
jgi:hypothetical protein